MWILNGVQANIGRVRQHSDLSYWVSQEEIVSALGDDARSGHGPWALTPAIANLVKFRRRAEVQANFDSEIGALAFRVERKDDWDPHFAGMWADDEAASPGDPLAAARAFGRGIVWHLEGFDRVRQFMVEDFELSHRISEDEILAALGNPRAPYHGGMAPTAALVELIAARIGLRPLLDVEYQVNSSCRYGLATPSSGEPG